jgi:hypothetical protein
VEADLHTAALTDPHALLQQMRWRVAVMRMETGCLRLGLALKAGFDPNQPRVPAGNPDGGQWTRVGEGVGDQGQVSVAQNATPRRYSINLLEEELRGGHTRRDHVAKTDSELIAVLDGDWRRIRGSQATMTIFRPAQGSFLSIEAANDFVNRVLAANQEKVDLVASGRQPGTMLERRFGYVTGKEAFRSNADAAPRIRRTYGVRVVIRYDPQRDVGYRVLTAFPVNEFVVGR